MPHSIDQCEKGAVNPIRDQSSCDSCLVFRITAAYVGTHAIATGKLHALSESNIVDCADIDCKGCNGRWPNKALLYVIQK